MRHKPVGKLSRSLGIALTEKAARIMEKRPYPPGDQGRNRRRQSSPYKERLVEKQRLRFQYNVTEKHLQRVFERASRSDALTGEALLSDLERRLDAMVMRAGFAKTIYQARQFVVHRHIEVDGKRIDRPAFRVLPGQTVAVRQKSRSMTPFEWVVNNPESAAPPSYLEVNNTELSFKLVRIPARSEIPVICNEQFVVEYYAR